MRLAKRRMSGVWLKIFLGKGGIAFILLGGVIRFAPRYILSTSSFQGWPFTV